jgi:hypothetical protein
LQFRLLKAGCWREGRRRPAVGSGRPADRLDAPQATGEHRGIFDNARVELLLNNAVGYGLNAVQNAVKDKTLTVEVGNEVLAKALQYAVEKGSGLAACS